MKDSFADLALAPLGFDELFRAQWIFGDPGAPPGDSGTEWTVSSTDDDLDEWTRAADLEGTIRGELLADASVRILAVRGADDVSAGAIANRTGPVVGVSNVFTTAIPGDGPWAGIAAAIAVVWPSLPLVAYEHGQGLHAALVSGFTEIGPLRVWLQPPAGAG